MASREGNSPPADVCRALRQEAGFGCCKCGFPFFEYHHIIPWNIERHYRVDDMMILCSRCHDRVTFAHVPEKEQRQWKAAPENIQKGYVNGLLDIYSQTLVVNLGSVIVEDCFVLIQVDKESFISARVGENNNLLLSFKSYDAVGNLLFEIRDNKWITGRNLPWYFEAKWRHIKLRHKLRNVVFEIDARQSPIFIRGELYANGYKVIISDKSVNLGDICLKNLTLSGAGFETAVGMDLITRRPRIFPNMSTSYSIHA